jgi:hypothetical protein
MTRKEKCRCSIRGHRMRVRRSLIAILRWSGWIFLGVLILFLALIAYLLVRESMARSKYRAEYPPPGQMVNLGTHSIHLYCVGAGSPTVVFEADLDQYGSLSWDSVQGDIGKFARACSYDRAGIMWSEPGPLPRDGERIVSESRALQEAGHYIQFDQPQQVVEAVRDVVQRCAETSP